MKAIKFLALGLLATMIVSCSSDEVALSKKEVAATLTGNIGPSLKTRAFNDQWEANDRIGVFINEIIPAEDGAEPTQTLFEGNFNTEFVTENDGKENKFTPAASGAKILYPSNKHELSFHAYYPYTESVTEESPVFIPNWTDQTKSQNLDLLVSDTQTGDKDHQRVELTFKHKFARVILEIKINPESQIVESDLENLKITAANMSADVEYDVVKDEWLKKDVNTAEFDFNTQEDGKLSSAIICPGVNDSETIRKVTFELADGRHYAWEIDPNQKFEEGNSYSWSITLTGKPLVDAVLIGTIVNWSDGKIEGDSELDFKLEDKNTENGENTSDEKEDNSEENSEATPDENPDENPGENTDDAGSESNS